MEASLSPALLLAQTESRDVEQLDFGQLLASFQQELGGSAFLPDGTWLHDPRSGDRVLFNPARAARPHDNRPGQGSGAEGCVVCQGRTTRVLDLAPLSDGYTFINKNHYPLVFPRAVAAGSPGPAGARAVGLHFLQWTSTRHEADWHNMGAEDRLVVMRRLAALERTLLRRCSPLAPDNAAAHGGVPGTHGHVCVIKNCGRLVGGSLAHGHQQVVFCNVLPRRLEDDLRFERAHGASYARFILEQTPAELVVKNYGEAVLLVPFYMRRPYDMQLVLKETTRSYLHQLDPGELRAVSEGWHDALCAIHRLMPRLGRELAYNVTAHNGPGPGLYFEFLPYTQETGGYEHLGLLLCQGDPGRAAGELRELLVE